MTRILIAVDQLRIEKAWFDLQYFLFYINSNSFYSFHQRVDNLSKHGILRSIQSPWDYIRSGQKRHQFLKVLLIHDRIITEKHIDQFLGRRSVVRVFLLWNDHRKKHFETFLNNISVRLFDFGSQTPSLKETKAKINNTRASWNTL